MDTQSELEVESQGLGGAMNQRPVARPSAICRGRGAAERGGQEGRVLRQTGALVQARRTLGRRSLDMTPDDGVPAGEKARYKESSNAAWRSVSTLCRWPADGQRSEPRPQADPIRAAELPRGVLIGDSIRLLDEAPKVARRLSGKAVVIAMIR